MEVICKFRMEGEEEGEALQSPPAKTDGGKTKEVEALEEEEVEFFKQLLRFRTVSAEGPRGEYARCAAWIKERCEDMGLQARIVEAVKGKPVVVATLLGTQPELPAVLLNSHYDVVPAMEEFWKTEPFAAVETDDGRIYGRGTQDMKCVCAGYLLALRRILNSRSAMRRTLHLTFVPDEEIGGKDGMGAFIESGSFDELRPVGVALDEGIANPSEENIIFYGERAPLWIIVTARGPTGHGSRFIPGTAVQKLINVAGKAIAFREAREKELGYPEQAGCKHCEAKKLGDVVTLNLTMLDAGVSADGGKTYSLNVIPTQAKAGFDIRVPPSVPIVEITAMLDEWCAEEGMSWEFAEWAGKGIEKHAVSSIEDGEDRWWGALKRASAKADIQLRPEIFPAGTDSRFLREIGIPAYGFSPLAKSRILLHEHNEYIDRSVFLRGIRTYEVIIQSLCEEASPSMS